MKFLENLKTTAAAGEPVITEENLKSVTITTEKSKTTEKYWESIIKVTKKSDITEGNWDSASDAKKCKSSKIKPQSVQSLEVSLDPGKKKERKKQERRAFENFDRMFGTLDMEKSYSKLFELLWYGQLPCFDVPGITSAERDELFLK